MINGANWGKYNCENLVVGLRGSVKPPQITALHLRTVHIFNIMYIIGKKDKNTMCSKEN